MEMDRLGVLTSFIHNIVVYNIPLLYGTVGEIVVEKAGCLNLGVEGIMAVGAIFGYICGCYANSLLVGTTKESWGVTRVDERYAVTIQGSGKIYLGGKNGSNNFGGLVAGDVTIAEGATGTREPGKANLWVDFLTADKLTINGGSAYIRTSEGGGDTTDGNTYYKGALSGDQSSTKSATINGGLYINGGYLKMGRQGNGATQDKGNRGETNKQFANIIKHELVQKGGEAEIHGKTYLDVSKIEQSGGTMKLAYDSTAAYDYLRLGQDTAIIQSGDSSTLEIEGMIISGSNGKGSRKIAISQSGKGTISLGNGIMFTGSKKNASSVTQSGGGTINLNGDYTSTFFDIEQKESGGTINLGGNMKANTVTQNGTGTIVVAEDKILTANTVKAGENGTSVEISGDVSLSGGSLKTRVDEDGVTTVINTGWLTATNVTVNLGELNNTGNMEVNGKIELKAGTKLVNTGTISGSSTYALMTADGQSAAAPTVSAADLIVVGDGAEVSHFHNAVFNNGGAINKVGVPCFLPSFVTVAVVDFLNDVVNSGKSLTEEVNLPTF